MSTLLIDTGNLYYCVGRKYPYRKIDYQKILESLTPTKAVAFVADVGEDTDCFADYLKGLGYIVITKRPRRDRIDNKYKTNWLVEFTHFCAEEDSVILGSNSPDLVDLINLLDVPVKVFACGVPQVLRRLCEFLELDDSFLLETA